MLERTLPIAFCVAALTACGDDSDPAAYSAAGTGGAAGTGAAAGSGGAGGTSQAGSGGGGGAGGANTGGTAGVGDCQPAYPAPEVELASHGAVGDGTTDDTAALHAAFAVIEASGGTVVFETGKTYLISDKIELRDATNFGIRGNGATLMVAAGTPTDDHCPLSFRSCSSFAVGDLSVNGNRQNRTPEERSGGHNIRIRGTKDFTFCRVASHNATTDGFYVAPTDNADPTTFPEEGVFQECHADFNFRQGMSIINGRRLQVIDSTFTNTFGTSPQAGVDIEPNSGSAEPGIEHVLFRGCLFEGNEGYGLTMGGHATMDRLTVEGSTFRANIHGAMTIRAGWALVQNNIVENHTGWVGFNIRDVNRAHDIVVRGNTFRNNTGIPDSGDAWIYVDDDSGTNNYLLENMFENNEDRDIANNNPTGTCAAGNLMDGQLDAPLDTCGQPPTDIGFGSGP